MRWIGPLLCAIVMTLSAAAFSAPSLVHYQGRLVDTSGSPVNGQQSIEIRLWDDPTSSDPEHLLYGPQTFPNVHVEDGQFNLVIGPEDESGRVLEEALTSDAAYVGLSSSEGMEVIPRQRILSAPYALRAQEADHAGLAAQSNFASALNSVVAPQHAVQPPGAWAIPSDHATVPGMSLQIEAAGGRPIFVCLKQGILQHAYRGLEGTEIYYRLRATKEDTAVKLLEGASYTQLSPFPYFYQPLAGSIGVFVPTEPGTYTISLDIKSNSSQNLFSGGEMIAFEL